MFLDCKEFYPLRAEDHLTPTFFDAGRSDMVLTLQRVDAVLALRGCKVNYRRRLPRNAHRLTFASFPPRL